MAGRPREFDPEQALEQAMVVFWQKGFTDTSLSDLERATGLGRQSLYGVFGDKRALFSQVVEHYFARVLKPAVELLEAPGSPLGNIERLFNGWEDYACSPLFRGCLVDRALDSAASDSGMEEFLRRKLAYLEAALERTLRRAREHGEVPADLNPEDTARAIVTVGQGLAVVARVNQERSYIRGILNSARRLLR